MNAALWFEDGHLRVGRVLEEKGASLLLEAPSGKRSKVKAQDVLFRFEAEALADFLSRATALASELDLDFLWQVAERREFDHLDLAREYWGREPTALERAALLLRLHGAPMYFYRKGRGRYKAAPPEALKAALAAEERKRREAERLAAWVAELEAGRLPDALRAKLPMLLYAPDRNDLAYKAVEKAAERRGLSPLALLAAAGAIPDPGAYHLEDFLRTWFPEGRGHPAGLAFAPPPALPEADVAAFSIDDETTTEIDDALSLCPLSGGRMRLGVHIAAPALGVPPASPLDAVARARASTVYMPGDKITMLPEDCVAAYTLAEGRATPALSVYFTVGADLAIEAMECRLERVTVHANLRHESLEPLFNADTIGRGVDYPFRAELEWLWRFAKAHEQARGVSDNGRALTPEYSFRIEGGRVRILPRVRGTPIDTVVAETMILANGRLGTWLADQNIPAIFRVQTQGKTRMSVTPAPHQGLGVDAYAWASSPLRRYVDLVNQRQLLALVQGLPAPHDREELEAIARAFETAYTAYDDFQRRMERYWTLVYLRQEDIHRATATVLRENLVRFDHLPLLAKPAAQPELAPGTRVLLTVRHVDLLTLELATVFENVAMGSGL